MRLGGGPYILANDLRIGSESSRWVADEKEDGEVWYDNHIDRAVNFSWAQGARSEGGGVEGHAEGERGAALVPLRSVKEADTAGGDLVDGADHPGGAALGDGAGVFRRLGQLPHGPADVGLYGAGQLFFA